MSLIKYLSISHRKKTIEAIGVGAVYGFTNFILLVAYAVTFRFAAYLLTLHVDHTLYANFDEVFTVFLAIILGSLAAGQASTALPLATQATAAASKLEVIVAPQQEGEEWEGKELVSRLTSLSLSHRDR